jgi:Asp-tRNA(Asn)/Glu-tRNA(Gln) amidotransferase A subunit family amidase
VIVKLLLLFLGYLINNLNFIFCLEVWDQQEDVYVCFMLQVRTIMRNSFKEALNQYDISISLAALSVAYKIGKHLHIFPFVLLVSLSLTFAGENKNDSLAMYASDIMTVSISLFLLAKFSCSQVYIVLCFSYFVKEYSCLI